MIRYKSYFVIGIFCAGNSNSVGKTSIITKAYVFDIGAVLHNTNSTLEIVTRRSITYISVRRWPLSAGMSVLDRQPKAYVFYLGVDLKN